MGKLKLNLEDLKVESFATTPDARARRGTVFGQTHLPDCNTQGCTEGCTMANDTCIGPTCGESCAGWGCGSAPCTQEQTCPDTCNHGATYACATVTDCNCFTNGYTCDDTCTSQGCTACNNVC